MDKLGEKLSCVPKVKILNELNFDSKERNTWDNKTKRELIDYCINNCLLSAQKIIELYNLYKDSSNAVIYILESSVDKFDYSTIDVEHINRRLVEINAKNTEEKIAQFKHESFNKADNNIFITLTYTKEIRVIYGGEPTIEGFKPGDILAIKTLEDASIFHFHDFNKFVVKCNDWSAIKIIKELINKVFSCNTYHPKFTKE